MLSLSTNEIVIENPTGRMLFLTGAANHLERRQHHDRNWFDLPVNGRVVLLVLRELGQVISRLCILERQEHEKLSADMFADAVVILFVNDGVHYFASITVVRMRGTFCPSSSIPVIGLDDEAS